MFLVEFNRDTELATPHPPYNIYMEKGDKIKASSWKAYGDMILVNTFNCGEISIFNEDITISEKTPVFP